MSLTAAAFAWVQDVVRCDAAIELEDGKDHLVESRLGPLARTAGCDIGTFIERARATGDRRARMSVVDALTTNETSWFRDNAPYVALESEMLPALAAIRPVGQPVRIWSAACSTGQEPYSIAMVIHDAIGAVAARSYQIVATDISETALAQARSGAYSQLEVNRGLPAPRLVKNFDRQGMRWVVNDSIRSLISFKLLNLATAAPPMTSIDIVFLRNVLIYFSETTRRQILERVRRVCHADSYLLLGGAEGSVGVDNGWVRQQIGRTYVYRPR